MAAKERGWLIKGRKLKREGNRGYGMGKPEWRNTGTGQLLPRRHSNAQCTVGMKYCWQVKTLHTLYAGSMGHARVNDIGTRHRRRHRQRLWQISRKEIRCPHGGHSDRTGTLEAGGGYVLVGHLGGSMSPGGGRKTVISESVCQPSERVAGLGTKDRIRGGCDHQQLSYGVSQPPGHSNKFLISWIINPNAMSLFKKMLKTRISNEINHLQNDMMPK